MIARAKRLFPRRDCRLPIQYRPEDEAEFTDAVLYNCSRTGMYFEHPAIVMPEENLHIILPTCAPTLEGPEGFPYYIARAIWCRSIPDDTNPRYGCGAVLLKRSRRIGDDTAESICHICDMCGAPIPCTQLKKTDEFLYLCPSCDRHLGALPEGRVKQSILRVLIGNTL